jgi:pre-mRNA-processing factor SLU7
LLNLDLKSAFYDPKSRSMRENPLPKGSENFNSFKGDNIYLNTGDATKLYE